MDPNKELHNTDTIRATIKLFNIFPYRLTSQPKTK